MQNWGQNQDTAIDQETHESPFIFRWKQLMAISYPTEKKPIRKVWYNILTPSN